MKNFYILLILWTIATAVTAQPVFNWTSQDIKTGKNLQKMTIYNNSAVIAGYGRTMVKSTDNGVTWKDTEVLKATFDFMDLSFKGNTGYLVSTRTKLYDAFPDVYTNGVILSSADGGNTWVNVDLSGLGSGDDPALDPTTLGCFGLDFQSVGCANDSIVYCYLRWMEYKPTETSGYLTHAGIFKSTNKGKSWKNLSGDLGSTVISTIAFADTVGYIGGNKKLYKVNSKNDVLTDIFANLKSSGNGYVNDITVINKNEIYVTTVANGVYKSTDGGLNFTAYTITGITGGSDFYKVSDNSLILVGNSGKSRVSNDGGTTWVDCKLATAIWEVGGVMNDSLYVLAKSDIYKISITNLTGGTFSWVTQTLSPDNNLQKANIFDANKMMIAGAGQTFKMSTNKGKSWSNLTFPAVPLADDDLEFPALRNVKDTAYATVNRYYLADYPSTSTQFDIYFSGGILKTTDNWNTYTSIDAALVGSAEGTDPSKNPQLAICNGFNPSVMEYLGNNILLVWGRWYDVSGAAKVEHNRVFRSADGGKSWKAVSDDFGGVYVMDIKFNGNTGYVAGNKILLKSTDKGLTFTDIYPTLKTVAGTDQFINAITLGADNEFFLTTTTANFKTVDGGATFTKIPTITGGNDYYKFNQKSFMVLGTTSKSFFTNNDGANWQACSTGATIYEIGGVWNETLYALGQGKVYKLPVSGLALSAMANKNTLKGELGVYYNPEGVELSYFGKNIERCTVYSITGQIMSDLQPFAAKVRLYNNDFSTGVYFVRCIAEGKELSGKIVIR